jgi:hypothetical protein
MARDKDGVPGLLSFTSWAATPAAQDLRGVVHNELAVVFTAMLDDAVCNVDNARFLLGEINNLRRQAFFAFRLDGGCAIGEGFLDERNDVGL